MESVLWSRLVNEDETLELGRTKAQADRDRKIAERGDLPDEDTPVYIGYFEGSVALIRGRPTDDANKEAIRCAPGVFDVEHVPEADVFAHAHIELLGDFLEALKRQMRADGLPGGDGELGNKNGRVHAINMLVSVFESGGLWKADGSRMQLTSCQPA